MRFGQSIQIGAANKVLQYASGRHAVSFGHTGTAVDSVKYSRRTTLGISVEGQSQTRIDVSLGMSIIWGNSEDASVRSTDGIPVQRLGKRVHRMKKTDFTSPRLLDTGNDALTSEFQLP